MKTTHNIRLNKLVHSGSSGAPKIHNAYVTRQVQLPFIPFTGLIVTDGNLFVETLQRVGFSLSEKSFYCNVEADLDLCRLEVDRPLQRIIAMQTTLNYYLSIGWSTPKVHLERLKDLINSGEYGLL